MRILSFLLLILFTFSCAQETDSAIEAEETQGYFGNFPDSPFLNISFNETINSQKELLMAHDFQFDEENRGINQENVEVFLGGDEKLTSLKVLFFNQKESDFESKTQFFKENAIKNDISSHFATFEFETSKNDFSLSMFMFEGMIRLQYRLSVSH